MRLLITDTCVVVIAVALAQFVRFGKTFLDEIVSPSWQTVHSVILMILWLSALALFRTRSARVLGFGPDEFRRVVSASFWIFGVIAIASLLLKLELSRGYLAVALPVGTIGLLAGRWLWRQQVRSRRRLGECMTRLVVVGERGAVSELVGEVRRRKDNAYRVVGVGLQGQTERSGYLEVGGERIPVIGDEEEALAAIKELGASTVVLAGGERLGSARLRYLVWDLKCENINLLVSPTASPLIVKPIPGYPLLQVEGPEFRRARSVPRRSFDIIFAAVALTLSSPLLLLAAVAIRLTTRGPAVCRVERIGLGGGTFQLVRFRTVEDGVVLPVGRLLRRFNIDRIPQLLNVLTGDMSVFGPRPQLRRDASIGSEATLRVRPGITGLDMKRYLDFLLVFVSLPLWLPLLITIGLVKLAVDGAPLFYLSQRIGRNGVAFTVYKFRTMVDDQVFIQEQISRLGKVGFEAIPLDSPVYTKLGRVYERFQFVELPQLFNILKGDMSLVGYRPLPKSIVDTLEEAVGSDRLTQRHTFAPGITGFAQLSGKSSLSNEARLEIEISESNFFNSSTWFACVKTYLALLLSTASYVLFGSNENAVRLRDRCLFGLPARLAAVSSTPIPIEPPQARAAIDATRRADSAEAAPLRQS
jgi:lipopolysaccharide/colanic/teichoic acid biosynthesis glycosyltransferase